jgi:radical SAM protein with 4Fe4S-binding SPASM domain
MVLIDDPVAGRLKRIGINKVEGNLDGPNGQIYDRFRGTKYSFEKTIRGIKACLRATLPLRVNVTVNRLNFTCLADITDLAWDLGITEMAFLSLIQSGRGDVNFSEIYLTAEEYAAVVNPQLRELSRRYRGKMTLLYQGDAELMAWGDPAGVMPSCGAGRIHCTITSTGIVKPDVYFPDDDPAVIAGHVRQASLSSIWKESTVFQRLRQSPPGICRECPDAFCAGGNLYRSYKHYGTLMAGPDPDCPYLIPKHLMRIN